MVATTGSKLKGLARVEECYNDYGGRARELKSDGKGIISFLCAYVPTEIIAGAGFFPLRLRGNVHEPVTKGDRFLEPIACPFVRSCYDLSLKGKYDFCDGLIIPHACDSITTPYHVWKYTLEPKYSHFVNVPRKTTGPSLDFFKAELNSFRKSLAEFAKTEINDENLIKYIKLYNENRTKVKQLYELRKSDPPLVSGSDMVKILSASMSLPVEESNQLLDESIAEIKTRERSDIKSLPRLLIMGGTVDNHDIVTLIEDCGSNVVCDSTCVGTRDLIPRVEPTDDPMDGLAKRYLDKINCPRTQRDKVGTTFQDDLEARFGDVGKYAKEYKIDGVIMYTYRYCDPFGFEISARKAYLESLDLPNLYIEDGYFAGTMGRLRTRIQAFLEMIE